MVRQASEFGSLVHRTPQPYGRLVKTYPGHIRVLQQWGSQNHDQLAPTIRSPTRELSGYMIGELGRVGDNGTHASRPMRRDIGGLLEGHQVGRVAWVRCACEAEREHQVGVRPGCGLLGVIGTGVTAAHPAEEPDEMDLGEAGTS